MVLIDLLGTGKWHADHAMHVWMVHTIREKAHPLIEALLGFHR